MARGPSPKKEAEGLLNYLEIINPDSRNLLHEAFARANSNSVAGWQKELSPEQLKQVETEAGSLLQRLGYFK